MLVFLFRVQGIVLRLIFTFRLRSTLFCYSDLKGKSAVELALSESPVKNLLTRHNVLNKGLSIKTSEINGNNNGVFQRSFSRTGPVSPGTESVFSLDEVLILQMLTLTIMHFLYTSL